MPLLDRKSVVAAKAEVTAGTAVSLAAADGAMNCYNWKLEPDIQFDDRPGQAGFSQLASIHGIRMGRATFETDLVGSGADGTPPFWMSVLAVACGMDLTTDALACGTTTRTITLGGFKDGLLESIAGACGSFVINLNAGRAGRIAWTFTGKIVNDTDTAIIAPTFPTTLPPRWAGGTASIHSLACQLSSFSLDRGAEIIGRQDPADSTGILACHVVDAKPKATADPEATLVATKNFQSLQQAHTEGALSIVVGTVAGSTFTIASSTAQILQAPTDARDKIVTRALDMQLNGTTAFSITQS